MKIRSKKIFELMFIFMYKFFELKEKTCIWDWDAAIWSDSKTGVHLINLFYKMRK